MRLKALMPGALAAAGLAVWAPVALTQTWNSGYGWWPSGYGNPPVTVQHPNWRCSVTAYGPTYRVRHGNWVMYYGGGTSCADGIGRKSLHVYVQTLGRLNGTRHWFTVRGTGLTTGPSGATHVRLIRTRQAYLGHSYRVMAVATLVLPNAYAGHPNATSMVTIRAHSRGLAP